MKKNPLLIFLLLAVVCFFVQRQSASANYAYQQQKSLLNLAPPSTFTVNTGASLRGSVTGTGSLVTADLVDTGALGSAAVNLAGGTLAFDPTASTAQIGIASKYVAPAAYFEPGTRTGSFRTGKDELITAANGESRISMEDYAIAMVDELENGAHRRQRVSVGY